SRTCRLLCSSATCYQGRSDDCASLRIRRVRHRVNRAGVFLDLNGTLVLPLKQERLEDLTLIPGVAEALARLSAAGFVCPVVTVQARIAKGLFSMADFQTWFATFAAGLKA